MAGSPSTTSTPPPAEQGQPTRPTTFDASWDATDASAFDPASLPLAKAPRAWERQPHSPFARNGKYRKVWKRNELRTTRSQAKASNANESLNKGDQSAMQSPRKVVKKRVLDAPPTDPTATPGRVRPKSKAFAPTRYDSPRRHSGRIARKLVSTDLAESSSAVFGSVWTGDKSKNSVTVEKVEQNTDGRDAHSTDTAQSETMKADTAELTTSKSAVEETGHGLEKESVSPLTAGEEEAGEQVVEQTTKKDQEGVTTELDAAEQVQDTSFEVDTAPANSSLEPTNSSTESAEVFGQNEAAESNVADPGNQKSPGAEELENSDPATTETPEDKPRNQMIDVVGEQEPTVQDSEIEPEPTSSTTAAPDDAPIEATVNSDLVNQDLTTDGPENDTKSEVELDDQNAPHSETAIPETATASHAFQGPEAEVSVQESVAESGSERPTDALEDHRVAQEPDVLPNEAKLEERDEPHQSADLVDGVEDSTQDATSSSSKVEPPKRPNLEFSASSLFGEAPDAGEEEKEPEVAEAEQNVTGSDGSEDADGSLIDMPSPSLSNTESPRFASVADTLTLHLPDNLSSREDDTSEEDATLESPTDADTAYLKEFLSRSDAAKANRTASMSKRESLTNRRDSGRVRQALASPRVALESKDPNSPLSDSPSKRSRSEEESKSSIKKPRLEAEAKALAAETTSEANEDIAADFTSSQSLSEKKEAAPESKSTRRSSRARTTRIPSTPAAPNRIPVRRADGNEPVVLKKTEAQELAIATRTNTRRNKGGAVAAPARLKKLQAEALKAEPSSSGPPLVCSNPEIEIFEASRIKWDQQLVYFQGKENSTPDSLSDDELASGGVDESLRSKKAATPRARRTRGLGASNGTPAKGLLAPASLLPESVQAEVETTKSEAKKPAKVGRPKKASAPAKETPVDPPTTSDPLASLVESAETPRKETPIPLPKPNPPKIPQSQLPTPAAARKSRLQSPKKIKLPGPVQPAAKQAQSKAGGVGITSGTPKKMPVTRVGATSGESTGNATGSGMSIGQRRRAGRRV
ncbi:hypothetical protein IWX50DRAFT_656098 [Phyllosticta citricarpa]